MGVMNVSADFKVSGPIIETSTCPRAGVYWAMTTHQTLQNVGHRSYLVAKDGRLVVSSRSL